MLRITEQKTTEDDLVLILEGRLTGPWVELLHSQCATLLAAATAATLDLRELAFADAAGLSLLANLQRQHIHLQNCPPFLAEQLRLVTNAKPAA
ncbi:MAG: STAS domain-containing protein [Acidobacteria bacterium]|nr:STAS domain-containing protein [Acidobacteriota bacterium]MBI3422504.1 STAS domain-containing protein [Acidobacteriota bacterium]